MHITIDNCSLCHDTRVVRLQGKHYPCPECVTMVHVGALHTIRYSQRIHEDMASSLIKDSLLHGLAQKVAGSNAVVFRQARADVITNDWIGEASVCVVSAEARLKLEKRQQGMLRRIGL